MTDLKKRIIKYCFLSMCFFFILHLNAKDVFVKNLDNFNGLSQNSISDILQDSSGLIWISTGNGLNVYNGYTFKTFFFDPDNKNCIGSNDLTFVKEDKNGYIWVGSSSGIISQIDTNTGRVKNYTLSINGHLKNYRIDAKCFYENERGQIFIGTDHGLFKLNSKKNVFENIERQTYTVNSILPQKDKILLGTDQGLFLFENGNRQYVITKLFLKNNHLLDKKKITSLLNINNTQILAGTSNGLYTIFIEERKIVPFTLNNSIENAFFQKYINSTFIDKEGNFWIGNKFGLYFIDAERKNIKLCKTQISKPYSVDYSHISTINQDAGHNLWFGTYGKGLNILPRYKPIFDRVTDYRMINKLISSCIVLSVLDEPDFLWIGLISKGVLKINKNTGFIQKYLVPVKKNNFEYEQSIKAIAKDLSGNIWIAQTGVGLFKYNKKSRQFLNYTEKRKPIFKISSNIINKIFFDSRGFLWIGTEDGLNQIYLKTRKNIIFKTEKNRESKLIGNTIKDIIEDKNGDIWIGTRIGLSKYVRSKNKFKNFIHNSKDQNSLSHNAITSLFVDRVGHLWVGTHFSGLNLYCDKTDNFKRYTTKNGLPNNTIYGILEDRFDDLWLSTNRGISKFNFKSGIFRNYNQNDNLKSLEFKPLSVYKNMNGRLFFGGVNGIDTVLPKKVETNTFMPQIVITGLIIDGESVFADNKYSIRIDKKEYNLSYRNKTIKVSFASMDFNAFGKNKYAYKIEGIDKEWNYLGTMNYIVLKNLPSGNYRFKVKGSNSAGLWNEEGTYLDLIISPPFWKKLWFFSIVFLFIVVTLFYLYKFRLKILTQRMELRAKIDFYCKNCKITEREKEVIFLVLEGKSNKSIEDALYISQNTIKNHIHSIYTKLNVKNRLQLKNLFKE